ASPRRCRRPGACPRERAAARTSPRSVREARGGAGSSMPGRSCPPCLPRGELFERLTQCVRTGARLRLQGEVGAGMPDHPRIVTERLEVVAGLRPDHEVAVELQEDYRNAQCAQVRADILLRDDAQALRDDRRIE